MDRGAHFFQCDFQVHTPRDAAWTGPVPTSGEDRLAYAKTLISGCREKSIHAIAVTDHHCMAFVPFIRQAALEELDGLGNPVSETDRIIVFPGMELTLGVPCQALLIFDADFPDDMLPLITVALAINQNDASKPKAIDPVVRMDGITSFGDLYKKLDEHAFLRGRYIVLPNLTDEGKHSIFRNGQQGKYAEMPCVGGYSDGEFSKLSIGVKNRIAGKDPQWGRKRVACIQTSDARRSDHKFLGKPSTWVKWATPTAEALRQACLAQESRISLDPPHVPETYIASISIGNSKFLGPLDTELNPQYSALIGGRGTGKSTVLEYVRWALCDQPPSNFDDDAPNYQSRRARLIEQTLKPLGEGVTVTYMLNGVPHVVRRSSVDGTVQMKIGREEFRSCSEEQVRTLLPIQAYSQKQLSDVSVRIDELTRFITAPIKGDLDRLERKATDRANKMRETFATRQRFNELNRTLANRVLEHQSITGQAESLKQSLTGLSDADRQTLDQANEYSKANSEVERWRASAETIRRKVDELTQIVTDQAGDLLPVAPDKPEAEAAILQTARQAYANFLSEAQLALSTLSQSAEAISEREPEADVPWTQWDAKYEAFRTRYNEAVERSSSHRERLEQLRNLEARAAELAGESTRTRETLASLKSAGTLFDTARGEWLTAQEERDALLTREGEALTERSEGAIRVTLKPYADAAAFVDLLRQNLTGSRVQSAKIEDLGQYIVTAEDPKMTWLQVLGELEELAEFEPGNAVSDERPAAPTLTAAGIKPDQLERMAQYLKPETWLSLALTPIKSVPVYEFRAKEADYIPFKNASAGQQATALLRTLLNQPGPPLIVDQPEEDLDNPVMLEIVEQLWAAKQMRQIIFASHNANLVVNGDAELVIWFGYRNNDDQSRGTIRGRGAIDVPEAREAIKQIMEGGENAFRLRREKYGF